MGDVREGARSFGYYLVHVVWAMFRLSWQAAMQLASWLNDDDRETLRRVLAVAVLGALCLVFRTEVMIFVRYGWDHDRTLLLRLAVVAVKLVAAVAIAVGLLSAGVGVLAAMVAVPVIALVNLGSAVYRGAGVTWRAWRAPRIAAATPEAAPADDTIVLVQLSDLHLGPPGREPYEVEVEPGKWGEATRPTSERLRDRVQRILAAARARAPGRPIVVTGDITDTGEAEEWTVAVDALAPAVPHVVLVPGNHDLSINRTPSPDILRQRQRGRRQRLAAAAARLADADAGATLRRVALAGATLFALDSNRYPSRYLLSNAVGRCGRGELAATTGPIAIAMHHHPARHAGEPRSSRELFMLADDGGALLALVGEYRARAPGNAVLVLHGHRHLLLHGEHRGVAIYGHPSSTLGVESAAGLDRTARYAAIHLTADQRWVVVTHAVETALPP